MNEPVALKRRGEGIDPAKLHWITSRPVALDHDGPTDISPEPLPTTWFEQPLLDSFAEIVGRHANRIAVNDGKTRLTYGEMLTRVDDLVARIDAIASPGRPVAAFVNNDVAFPLIFIAGFGIRRPLVLIDAKEAAERQAAILSETLPGAVAIASGLAVDESLIAGLPRIEIDPSTPGSLPRPSIRPDPEGPWMVVFTSGSTSRPKGIARGYRQVQTYIHREIGAYHINASDVILSMGSPGHGGGLWGPLAALFAGATLRLLDFRTDGLQGALRVIGDEGVTILVFVPTALRIILQTPGIARAFRSLRLLALGGEATQGSDIALFRSKLPAGCKIAIMAGSMDAGMAFRWFLPEKVLRGTLPVGYLEPGRSAAIVGEDGRSVAVGEAGELVMRGSELALGFWREGKLVEGGFHADPDDSRSRIYYTADFVRQRPNGLFEILGRADHMVKIRGLRVDLGEVEEALRNDPAVADAVATVEKREGENDRVIAFIMPADKAQPPSSAALRRRVVAETAEHMVPSVIHVLPQIPRLTSMKPDLRRLHAMAKQISAIHTV